MDLPTYGTSTPALRWTSLRLALLWAYDGPVAADNRDVTSDHRLGYWVWLIRRGQVQIKMRNKSWTARTGEWIISPQGVTTQSFSRDADILSIHFQCHWPTGENLFLETDGLVFKSESFPKLENSASRLARLVSGNFPGVRIGLILMPVSYPTFLKMQQRFMEWLINFYDAMVQQDRTLSHGGDGDERVWRAAECLHESLVDGVFPADRLVRETSLGRAQLDRVFWKSFGTTTREYWERLRQDAAMDSLAATGMSIKEIGYRLGFKQPSHFTKWFSRRLGKTPQEYRASTGTRISEG
jgi:AraC-like DNA-binding protein